MKNQRVKTLIMIISIILGSLLVIFYSLHPKLSDFRNSIYGFLVYFLTLSGIISYLAFSKKVNLPILGKITILIYVLLYLVFSLIDIGRIEALFFFLYSIYSIGVTIFLYIKNNKEYRCIWMIGMFSYISTIIFGLKVKYFQEMPPAFLIPSVLVALIIALGLLMYGIIIKDKGKMIFLPLIGIFAGFLLTYCTVCSMNVYLDISTPIYEEFIIVDKDIVTGPKQITQYKFIVEKEEVKFDISVPEVNYYDHEINDTITLSMYEGAFKVSYYIYDKK